jgi:hypothetical protein
MSNFPLAASLLFWNNKTMRCFAAFLFLFATVSTIAQSIPSTEAKTLDGSTITIPHDLTTPTVLLIGFSRKSADQTTAWQKHLHAALTPKSNVRVFDIAMLAAVPQMMRGLVTRTIRKQVPDQFEHDFLVVTMNETEWKQAAHFDPKAPDAAYVLLLNPRGEILWHTHETATPAAITQLTTRAQAIH